MKLRDQFTFKQKPTGLFKWFLGMPRWIFRLRLGSMFGHRFVLLEHYGRKSGAIYQTPLEVVVRDGDTYTVCSGTGPRADWYLNLKARPAHGLWVGSRLHRVEQRFLPDEEAGQALADYEVAHPKAAKRLEEAMGVGYEDIGVPRIEAAQAIPMIEFELAD